MRICKLEFCNKEILNNRNIFCSNSCSATYNNRGIRRHGKSPTIKICCYCKINFKSDRTRKYCSKVCKAKAIH